MSTSRSAGSGELRADRVTAVKNTNEHIHHSDGEVIDTSAVQVSTTEYISNRH